MKTPLMNLRKRLMKLNWLYAVHREIKFLKADRNKLWADAVIQFEKKNPKQGSMKDYKKAMRKHRVSYKEYYTYEFWHLSESERSKYLSEWELKCIYRKIDDVKLGPWFDNKMMTHLKFEKYMRRDWMCPSLSSFDSFCQFVSSKECIAKPWLGSLGKGVFEVKYDNENDLREIYENCRNHRMIIEERLQSCHEMSAFHPQSLNTIRVMTMSKGDKFKIIGCMFRMGVGDHVVDNGSAGGILTAVDPESGIVTTDGRDKDGNVYVQHPDTGIAFKGFVIPYWNKVVDACKEMSSYVPEKVFAGWDVCVLESGDIELIEVNSGPNIMGLQTSHGYGLRPKIQALGKEILGYDPIQLISIWERPFTNYDEIMQYKRHRQNADLLLKDYVDYLTKNNITAKHE